MIDGVTNADAIPVLERLLQFTGDRHRLIVSNIANLSTPGYRAVDLSVSEFQSHLENAILDRRRTHGVRGGPLEPAGSGGGTGATPTTRGDNILFHDQNDRDLDRTMQDLVENFMTYRMAAQLMRNRMEIVQTAIRERI